MNKIEFIINETNDWEILKVNGEVYYEDFSIPSSVWLELLEDLNFLVSEYIISNRELSAGIYTSKFLN